MMPGSFSRRNLPMCNKRFSILCLEKVQSDISYRIVPAIRGNKFNYNKMGRYTKEARGKIKYKEKNKVFLFFL